MENSSYSVVFFSANSNIIIAKKVKDILLKYNIHTQYSRDIDSIILKKQYYIDYLLLDFSSEYLDKRSFDLLKKLKMEGYIGEIVCITNGKDFLDPYVLKLNFEDCFDAEFEKLIKNLLSKNILSNINMNGTLIKIISDYLTGLGFSTRRSGFLMLVDSIVFYLSNNCVVKNLRNVLYPYIANKYKASVSSVEMQLRTSIVKAFEEGKKMSFYDCPTIKEFIVYSILQVYEKAYATEVIKKAF